MEALLNEIKLQRNYLQGETINTIYFGGGTPSLLTTEECNAILDAVRREHPIDAGAEITLEANPDDIREEKLAGWKSAGINRLSIGIQSFFENDLQWMNRAHDAGQATEALQQALGYFNNITIDLIYGTPGLSDSHWQENVQKAISLGIPHISCYALTVEPKTALHSMIERKKKEDINPDDQARQFMLLMKWLKEAGYEHYEISNFALPGRRSRHNSAYWQGTHYLGLGPSAHSFDGNSRQWNIANNALYIQSLQQNQLNAETELLDPVQRHNEYIMTSLRTIEGIDTAVIEKDFGQKALTDLLKNTATYIRMGHMIQNHHRFCLSDEGKLFADGIAASLFAENV